MKRIHKIALVSITPPSEIDNAPENPHDKWPGYGIRRIQADILRAYPGDDIDLIIYEYPADNIEPLLAELEEFSPDLIGGSAYIWSFELLVDVAQHYKQYRPDGLVVFGGPSARTCMMELEPYQKAGDYIDALCTGEGEGVINEILSSGATTKEEITGIAGLAIAKDDKWINTAPRSLLIDLDVVASPYQMDLMPHNQWGYLESYRGCPMSCSFCEWGVSGPNNRIFSRDYIATEMRAMLDANVFPGIFQLDAGLNLNAKGFKEFAAAAEETEFFRQKMLFAHVYPSKLKEEHMTFLRSCSTPVIGLGLQAFDQKVLKSHSRPAKIEHFNRVAHELAEIGVVEVQILFALPGDTPDGFMRALDFAMALPAQVRVFHTLVLPDALMTRALPEFDIKFDPYSLKVESCQGWSSADIERVSRELDDLADDDAGGVTNLWWSLNSNRTRSLVRNEFQLS